MKTFDQFLKIIFVLNFIIKGICISKIDFLKLFVTDRVTKQFVHNKLKQ